MYTPHVNRSILYRWFSWGVTSGGQELGRVFGAAMCKIQARKHYIEPVTKNKKCRFSQSEKSAVPLPLHYTFALWK